MNDTEHAPTISIHETTKDAEAAVARLLAAAVRERPDIVLGLATGNSMIGVYRHLAAMHRREALSFSGVTSFNLDEYCDLPADHAARFARYMKRHLFDHVDIESARSHLPDPDAGPEAGACFEETIAAADGIDLQLLGIGRNGHIGFNEPGAGRETRTRFVDLAPATRRANADDFPPGQQVPARAITMGIATILSAKRIVLLATSQAKAKATADAIEGPIRSENPATFLRYHPNVTIICDAAAATRLSDPEARRRHA